MLSWRNLADAPLAELTATREASGLAARNLLTEAVQEVWRIPAVAAGTVTDLDVTLPAAAEIGVLAVFAPRDAYLPPGYTVEVAASSVALGGTDVLSLPAAPLALDAGRGAWWHWPADPVTARYLRLRFTAASGDDYLQLGRLWIGPDIRPGYADWNGYRRGWRDAGVVERSAISGAASASRGATSRATRWTLPQLTDAQADAIEAAAAGAGVTRQVVACARSDRGARDLVLGRFVEPPEPVAIAPSLYRCDIAVLEDL